MAAGSLKIRSNVGRIESRSSRVSLTSKTMIGCSDIADLSFMGGERLRAAELTGRLLAQPPAWLPRPSRAPSGLLAATTPSARICCRSSGLPGCALPGEVLAEYPRLLADRCGECRDSRVV